MTQSGQTVYIDVVISFMRFLLLSCFLFCFLSSYAQPIVYVTEEGRGDGSGTSWGNALPGTMLASRLPTATAGTQFWIAAGTYKPTTTLDRSASFSITSGLSLYGGFSGGETTIDQRTGSAETRLSGDIGIVDYALDNSNQVVQVTNVNGTVTLNRVVVSDGRVVPPSPISSGAGVSVESTDSQTTIHLIDCHFRKNKISRSLNGGGGVFVKGYANAICRLLVSNCVFTDNEAGYGGALCLYTDGGSVSAQIELSTFRDNVCYEGGAISARYAGAAPGSYLTIARCLFVDNKADDSGGAISTGGLAPQINACHFQNNYARNGGAIVIAEPESRFSNCLFIHNRAINGGVVSSPGGFIPVNVTFDNCTFAANVATGYGGVAQIASNIFRTNNINFTNCIAWNNSASSQSFFYNDLEYGGAPTIPVVTYSLIEGGWAGMGNLNTDPLFVNEANNDYRLSASSPAIDAGDPNRADLLNARDFNNRPRIQGSRIDMGAYEFYCEGNGCLPIMVRRRL